MIKSNQKHAVYLKYGSVGIINTAVSGVTISLLSLTSLSSYINNFVGFSLGILTSFFLNGKWTFKQSRLPPKTFFLFLGAIVISYGVNLIVMTISMAFFPILMAQFMGILTYSFIFFIINKAYIFNQ
jgi:putative flippase GtrA